MEYNRTKFEKLWREHADEFWKETNENLNNFLNYITNINKDKNCKPNNKAPKSIKGDYDLSIHDNTIVLVDNVDGTTVEAKCHPDDDFDIGAGIKEVFKKLNEKREENRKQKKEEEKKIDVGDWVEVLYDAIFYPYHVKFFEVNNLMQYASRFCYGYIPESEITGKVLFIDKHQILLEAEDENGNRPIFLVDNYPKWLRKVEKPNA